MISPETVVTILGLLLASDWLGRLILFRVERKAKKKDEAEIFNPVECAKTLNNLQNGLCAVLRNEIVDAHRMYTRMGYCPLLDQENIKDMYEAYHELGGNDIATKLKNEILALPESPLSPHNK